MAAPAWSKECRPASFRGVPFAVRTRQGQGGRRGPDHEYPNRDEGYPEDKGRKMRGYSVEAFLFGADYMAAKKRLIEALEEAGPGEYIDYWGDAWKVQVRDFSWIESKDEGGYVAFKLDFKEYGKGRGHTVTPDTGYAVKRAADQAGTAVVGDFGHRFDPRGDAGVLGSATRSAGSFLDRVSGMLTTPSRSSLAGGQVSSLVGRVAGLRGDLTGRMASPLGFGGDIRELLSLALGTRPAGMARYQAARGFAGYGADFAPIAATTPSRAKAADNQVAMVDLVRGLAAVEAARASADIPFAVYDDAVAVRQEVASDLDARLLVAPDAVYGPVDRLRAASVRDITTRGADLSRLTEFTPGADMPALVLAQRLYGDAGREAELVQRNPIIRHPGFVPGGKTLKVASR